jgi:retinol dehydrogenase 12
LALDLGSIASIKAFVKRANKEFDRIDVLVENAGIFTDGWVTTEDGREAALKTKLISGALLATLFMPKFRETRHRPTSSSYAQTSISLPNSQRSLHIAVWTC